MTIEERVEKLEKELSRAKRRNHMLLAVLLLAVVLLAVGATTPDATSRRDVIKASKFVVEDGKGKSRAILAMDGNAPVLSLIDENKKSRASLGMSGLILYDKNVKPRAVLGVLGDEPMLTLFDENGSLRADLRMSVLILNDKNEESIAFLVASGLALFENGKTIWMAPP